MPTLICGPALPLQEMSVLSNVQHPNIIRLLGACPEHGMLVYELAGAHKMKALAISNVHYDLTRQNMLLGLLLAFEGGAFFA